MGKKWRFYVLLCCCLAVLSGLPALAAGRPFGDEAAELSACRISAGTAKPGDVLDYSFVITDKDASSYFGEVRGEASISSVCVVWQSEKKQRLYHTYTWDELPVGSQLSDREKGEYHKKTVEVRGKVEVSPGMCPGKWKISMIMLYSVGDEEDAAIVYIGNRSLSHRTVDPDLSCFDFTVSGSKADKKAPEIDPGSLSLTRKSLKYKQKATFRVKVSDQSRIKSVRCVWRCTKKNKGVSNPYRSKEYGAMKYNKKKKRYEYTMAGLKEKGICRRLYQIQVEDIYGNKASYSRNSGKAYKKAFDRMEVYSR